MTASWPVEFDLLWRAMGALALLAILIPVCGLVLRRTAPAVATADRGPRLTGRLPLGSGVSLVSVDFQGRSYLLSVGDRRAELIDRVDAAESPARLVALPAERRERPA